MTTGNAGRDAASVAKIIEAISEIQNTEEKLPSERDLADRLNIKRHQLRKALSTMRQSGTLMPPARGRPATTPQPRVDEQFVHLTNPLEVLELRMILEPGLARVASVRASALDIARIRDAATTPPGASYGGADMAFHLAVAAASRNYLAIEFYKLLRQVGVDARVRIPSNTEPNCPKRTAQRDAEHRAIAEAIAARDPEAAEAAMRAHLQMVQQRIIERTNAAAFAAA